MRIFLTKLFRALPSDLFSFIAGAIFSVAINLATARVNMQQKLRLPLELLVLSTLGFIFLVVLLNEASESAAKRSDPSEEYSINIYSKLPVLLIIMTLSISFLGYALWRLSH